MCDFLSAAFSTTKSTVQNKKRSSFELGYGDGDDSGTKKARCTESGRRVTDPTSCDQGPHTRGQHRPGPEAVPSDQRIQTDQLQAMNTTTKKKFTFKSPRGIRPSFSSNSATVPSNSGLSERMPLPSIVTDFDESTDHNGSAKLTGSGTHGEYTKDGNTSKAHGYALDSLTAEEIAVSCDLDQWSDDDWSCDRNLKKSGILGNEGDPSSSCSGQKSVLPSIEKKVSENVRKAGELGNRQSDNSLSGIKSDGSKDCKFLASSETNRYSLGKNAVVNSIHESVSANKESLDSSSFNGVSPQTVPHCSGRLRPQTVTPSTSKSCSDTKPLFKNALGSQTLETPTCNNKSSTIQSSSNGLRSQTVAPSSSMLRLQTMETSGDPSTPQRVMPSIKKLGSEGHTPWGEVQASSKKKRKFPGPAGLLPKLSKEAGLSDTRLPSPCVPTVVAKENKTPLFPCSQSSQEVFGGATWRAMLLEVGKADYAAIAAKYSLANIVRKASQKLLPDGKVPVVCAVIESIQAREAEASLQLRDPSGTIQGTVHRQLVKEYGTQLQLGSVLVLRQVGVFSPSARNHYLNITPNNLVKIYSGSSGGTGEGTDIGGGSGGTGEGTDTGGGGGESGDRIQRITVACDQSLKDIVQSGLSIPSVSKVVHGVAPRGEGQVSTQSNSGQGAPVTRIGLGQQRQTNDWSNSNGQLSRTHQITTGQGSPTLNRQSPSSNMQSGLRQSNNWRTRVSLTPGTTSNIQSPTTNLSSLQAPSIAAAHVVGQKQNPAPSNVQGSQFKTVRTFQSVDPNLTSATNKSETMPVNRSLPGFGAKMNQVRSALNSPPGPRQPLQGTTLKTSSGGKFTFKKTAGGTGSPGGTNLSPGSLQGQSVFSDNQNLSPSLVQGQKTVCNKGDSFSNKMAASKVVGVPWGKPVGQKTAEDLWMEDDNLDELLCGLGDDNF
ncbi:uncharacterized protein LOC106158958 [Lingula anatina]|uniref:Uncharacterized protein LOC106158958 n=1 Tax=Lingula anatina TaxID=7574 RepID=A0A1S3HWY7_LINAN|nr:uncharacterized protein LOC106158958 [Lingula anatina]|eukprot:XP_013390545.1 uncharacterized protein LOC106158958 [Lingula anatina]